MCVRCAQDAIALLAQEMSGAVKHICGSLAEQLASLGSKPSSSHNSSGSSSSAASLEQLQVVLHLVTSPFFRPAVVDGQLVQMLAEFLLAVPAEGPEGDAGSVAEFRNTLLHVLEAVSQVKQYTYMHSGVGAAGAICKADTGMCCMTEFSLFMWDCNTAGTWQSRASIACKQVQPLLNCLIRPVSQPARAACCVFRTFAAALLLLSCSRRST
jgi:hypothetical protein